MDKPVFLDSPFPFKDRRKFPRKSCSVPVQFMGQEIDSRFFSIDVGGGGIRLYTRQSLSPEKIYEFSLYLETIYRSIPVKAKVAWQRKLKIPDGVYEVGFVFQEVSKESRIILRDFLKGWLAEEHGERRKYLRVPRLLSARVLQGAKEAPFSGYVLDLSEDGVRFIASLSLEEKSAVSLKIEIEEGSGISINGRIAWANRSDVFAKLVPGMSYVYGMKIEVPSVELQVLINSYVNYRNKSAEAALTETLLSLDSGESER